MEIYSFLFVIFFILMRNISVVRGIDRPDMKFNKMFDKYMRRKMIGITSLDECWMICEQTVDCMTINYQRRTQLCQLNSAVGNTIMNLKQQAGFVFIEKPVYTSQIECGSEHCTDGELCDKQATQCKKGGECKPLEESDGRYIDGNLLETGSKIKIGCKEGFMPINGKSFTVISVCQNGIWNILLECRPLTCKGLAEVGITVSKLYRSYDEGSGIIIDIFCEFDDINQKGYSFLAPETLNSMTDISKYYTRRDFVMLRLKKIDTQCESKMEVLPDYRERYNVSLFISDNPNFANPTSVVTEPYMYMGFVPSTFGSHQGKYMGYSCNGMNNTFVNSDGNPNNYFAIFESSTNPPQRCWSSGQVHDGWMNCRDVSRTLPDTVFFDWYEIHMGGGGCLVRNCDPTVEGMAFGMPFNY